VAIEAIRGEKTLNQLGSHYGVHPVQVAQWRRAALEQLEAQNQGSCHRNK
jgi:transposase-like protein